MKKIIFSLMFLIWMPYSLNSSNFHRDGILINNENSVAIFSYNDSIYINYYNSVNKSFHVNAASCNDFDENINNAQPVQKINIYVDNQILFDKFLRYFKHKDSVKSLTISEVNSFDLSAYLSSFPNLEELILIYSRLDKIDSITTLQNLKILKLDKSVCCFFSTELCKNLKNLEELEIEMEYAGGIDLADYTGIAEFHNLKSLKLFKAGCSLVDIMKLKKLRYIDFCETGLGSQVNYDMTTGPESIDTLIIRDTYPLNLKNFFSILKINNSPLKVVLLHNDFIREIPDELFEIKEITYLSLGHNYIEKISDKIAALDSLSLLNLGYNDISELPESICDLKNLKYLHLENNKITKLPQNIKKLSGSLKELDLRGNPIPQEEINRIKSELKKTQVYF